MKIICILQNAWGTGSLPIIFRPSPFNKSAKTIKKICGANPYYFCNTTSVVTRTAAGKAATDMRHFSKVIKRLTPYDVILVCGKQAEKAVRDRISDFEKLGKPLLFIPHPAARTVTNAHLLYIKSILDNISPLNIFTQYDMIAG